MLVQDLLCKLVAFCPGILVCLILLNLQSKSVFGVDASVQTQLLQPGLTDSNKACIVSTIKKNELFPPLLSSVKVPKFRDSNYQSPEHQRVMTDAVETDSLGLGVTDESNENHDAPLQDYGYGFIAGQGTSRSGQRITDNNKQDPAFGFFADDSPYSRASLLVDDFAQENKIPPKTPQTLSKASIELIHTSVTTYEATPESVEIEESEVVVDEDLNRGSKVASESTMHIKEGVPVYRGSKSASTMHQDEDDGGLSFKDAEEKTFVPNVPSCSHPSLTPHPDPLVESASLRGAIMPPLTQRLRLPSRTFLEGLLTTAQLEGVARACAQHELNLPDGSRKGFLLGDGAGVGKGRQQAAVIFHNANHGRRRAVWLSVSADLIDDARRDLQDIGAGHLPCHDLRSYRADEDLHKIPALQEGIIFCTYSLLVSGKTAANSRLEQLLKLLGEDFDGVLSFDEVHRAKNLGLEEKNGKKLTGSRTAIRVHEFQARGPTNSFDHC